MITVTAMRFSALPVVLVCLLGILIEVLFVLEEKLSPISLASAEELVEELGRRFDCFVFVGEKDHTEFSSRYPRYKGPSGWRLGLAHIAVAECEEDACGPSEEWTAMDKER